MNYSHNLVQLEFQICGLPILGHADDRDRKVNIIGVGVQWCLMINAGLRVVRRVRCECLHLAVGVDIVHDV